VARRDAPVQRRVSRDERDVRATILETTERLLAQRRFDQLVVADVLAAAGVSRASFYFYFESKQAVLAELVRLAMAEARESAQPWLEHETGDVRESLRQGTLAGTRLWRKHAAVLRAIVENWRTSPELAELWTHLMEGFVGAATARIEAEVAAGRAPARPVDSGALAAALCWLDERVFYLAAIGAPPFEREDTVVDVLTELWLTAVYGRLAAGSSS
jgi:TetR/AcrR family transcriptional regulator, ethionamide resistance regulator